MLERKFKTRSCTVDCQKFPTETLDQTHDNLIVDTRTTKMVPKWPIFVRHSVDTEPRI